VDFARLIPGQAPSIAGRRKPPKAVRPEAEIATEKVAAISAAGRAVPPLNALSMLAPHPLLTRTAWAWLTCTVSDFSLVAVNWLLLGALLVPLQTLFPDIRVFRYAAGAPFSLLGIAVLHAALITLTGYVEGLHAEGIELRGQVRILGKSALQATTLLCFTYGLQGVSWATCALFFGAGAMHFGALSMWRWQSGRQHRHEPQCAADLHNVLIVGAAGVGRSMAAYVETHPQTGRRVYGFLDNESPLGNGVIGRVADLARLARTGFVDEVILAAPHDRSLALQVLREARRLRLDVKIVPEMFGCKPSGTEVERVGDLPMICLHTEQLPAAGLAVKRLVDVVGAGAALLTLSPLLATIAFCIKLDSRGSVLYRAQRAGRKGRLFCCYKYRTMVSNADELKNDLRKSNQRSGPFFKIVDDPRITRLGHFLRRYSLDELPQLWNVLKGDMSLVGPRPHPLDDVAAYEVEHLARLDVTPGITGLWQVTARRDPSFQRGMELDREYIRTWSLGSDMRILLKTFLAVVRGSGE